MINYKELRAGNLIKSAPMSIPRLNISSDGILELTAYGISCLESDTSNKLGWEAIPLTEEWLIKLGFEKKGLNERFGNGQDWQPITTKTEQQDFLLDLGAVFFLVRRETFYHTPKGSDFPVPDEGCWFFGILSGYYLGIQANLEVWREIDKVHLLQNLINIHLGVEVTIKE